MTRSWSLIVLGICLSARVGALTNPLADAIQRCAADSDPVKRLACFDALAITVPKVKADAFGLTEDIEHKRAPAAEVRAEEPVLPGKIAALHYNPAGLLIFTLDNSQVWIQAQVEPSKSFAVGENVHIEQGAMGSWWLAAAKARKTRVKRIS